MWYDPAYTCTDSTGTLLPCWLGATVLEGPLERKGIRQGGTNIRIQGFEEL